MKCTFLFIVFSGFDIKFITLCKNFSLIKGGLMLPPPSSGPTYENIHITCSNEKRIINVSPPKTLHCFFPIYINLLVTQPVAEIKKSFNFSPHSKQELYYIQFNEP